MWWLTILEDSDHADALGYHETTDQGLSLGKVFAHLARQEGGNWTITARHELLEMLDDPEISLTVFVQLQTHSELSVCYGYIPAGSRMVDAQNKMQLRASAYSRKVGFAIYGVLKIIEVRLNK
jgi:hypothetical protein